MGQTKVGIEQLNASGTLSSSTYLRGDGTWNTPAGSGTVTSVALSLPSFIIVSGSPVTTTGTLTGTLATQSANTHFIGPTTGAAAAPTFRTLVAADITTTGTASSSTYLRGDMSWATVSGGSPAGASTNVQFNSSGSFGGATQVLIDGTDNNLTLKSTTGTTAVTAPSAGNAKLYTLNRTGIDRLTWNPSVGIEQYVQGSVGRKGHQMGDPFSTFGYGYLANANIVPSSSNSFIVYNATNLLPNFNTKRVSTGTTSGTAAGLNMPNATITAGTTTYGGGVLTTMVFGLSTYNANQRIFIGVIGSTGMGAFPSGDPSSFVNIFGIGKDVADTTFQVMANDGSGVATKTNTSITPNATDVYIVTVFVPSNSTNFYVTIEDHTKSAATIFNSGAISTNIPAGIALAPIMMVSNGATAAARVIDIIQITQEVDF